jgi:hypothetical protein
MQGVLVVGASFPRLEGIPLKIRVRPRMRLKQNSSPMIRTPQLTTTAPARITCAPKQQSTRCTLQNSIKYIKLQPCTHGGPRVDNAYVPRNGLPKRPHLAVHRLPACRRLLAPTQMETPVDPSLAPRFAQPPQSANHRSRLPSEPQIIFGPFAPPLPSATKLSKLPSTTKILYALEA